MGIGEPRRLAALVVTLVVALLVTLIVSFLIDVALFGVAVIRRPIDIAGRRGIIARRRRVSVVVHCRALADEASEFRQRIVDRFARGRVGAAMRERIAAVAIGTEIVVGHKISPRFRRLRDTG